MNCPDCSSANTRTTQSRRVGRVVLRTHRCIGCDGSWATEERLVPDSFARAIVTGTPPVVTGRPPVARRPSSSGSSPDLDLSGSPEPSEKIGERTKPDKKPTAFDWALAEFCKAWRAGYGEDYKPTGPDKAQLGRLVQQLTREETLRLPQVFANYLHDRSTFVAEDQRHSLVWFCTKGNGWNKYRTQAKPAANGKAVLF